MVLLIYWLLTWLVYWYFYLWTDWFFTPSILIDLTSHSSFMIYYYNYPSFLSFIFQSILPINLSYQSFICFFSHLLFFTFIYPFRTTWIHAFFSSFIHKSIVPSFYIIYSLIDRSILLHHLFINRSFHPFKSFIH